MKKPDIELPAVINKAWQYAESNKSKFVSDLVKLVSQPSVSAQNIGLEECGELVRLMMNELGFRTRLIPVQEAPDVVYGELSGMKDEKTLVVYNHYDVQPVEPLDEWKTDPFEPVIKDGKIFGRGVGDDKGEIVARFKALESLLNTGGGVKPNLKWVIEGEEETGSRHFHDFVYNNKSLLGATDACGREATDLQVVNHKFT